MKVYIAGPMRGIPLGNFPAFDAAAAYLRARGYTVFNPADNDRALGFDGNNGEDVAPEAFQQMMRWDLARVMESDAVVFLPGWQNSRGAKAERVVAHYCGVPCYDLRTYQDSQGTYRRIDLQAAFHSEPVIEWTPDIHRSRSSETLPPARSAV